MSGFKYNTFAWMNMVHALSKLPVAIIIVNWNKKDLLHICLTSLKTVTSYPNYNVIVVDNGSSDGSANFVQENFSWTDLIALDKNFGFSIANNKGIAYALKKYNPAYFLLLNNDTKIIQADWIDKMVHLAESDSNTGIVGSKLVYPDGRTQYLGTQITASGFSWLTSSQEKLLPPIFEVDAVLGACFLIKRRLFDKIGYLDVGFSPYIHEESDYCMRARCAGWHVKMDLDVSVVHLWKSSMKKVQPEYVESVDRSNTVRFMLLNFPFSWLLKRTAIEMRILVGCFLGHRVNRSGVFSIRLRTGNELLSKLRINMYAYSCNLHNFKEIMGKRQNRTAKLLVIA